MPASQVYFWNAAYGSELLYIKRLELNIIVRICAQPVRGPRMHSGESKAQRFERVSERRVNDTLRALRLLGSDSDRRNFAYTDERIATILAPIDQEYGSFKARFKAEALVDAQTFRFKRGE